jgi:hypothetical protein
VKLGSSSDLKPIDYVIINANASLLVIQKYNQPTQFSEAPHLPVFYKAQKNNWMDKDIFLDWYNSVFFLPEVKEHLKT